MVKKGGVCLNTAIFLPKISNLIKGLSKDYSKEINHMRNIFAHAVLEVDEKTGRKSFKNGGITFDEDLCKQIRRDIIKNKESLNSLAEKIKE